MSDQMFLLTGENVFALHEERRRWIRAFVAKHGDTNLLRLYGQDCTCAGILDAVMSAPFLSERRLVVIDGLPDLPADDVRNLAQSMHPSTVLLCIDPKPDRRRAGVKAFLATATVRQFNPLSAPAIRQWIREKAREEGATIDSAACACLVDYCGEDQYMLFHEIKKLALFAYNRMISPEDVEKNVIPSREILIFRLTDLLVAGRQNEALSMVRTLLQQGHNAQSIWNILLWLLGNLVGVFAALKEGKRDAGVIAKETGVPFLSARSLLPFARMVSEPTLLALVRAVVSMDLALKTGRYRVTAEEPDELLLLIDRLILRF